MQNNSNEYYTVMNTPTNEYVNSIQVSSPENSKKGGSSKLYIPPAIQQQEISQTNRLDTPKPLVRVATPIPVRRQFQNRKLSCTVPNKPKLKPKPITRISTKITDLKGDNYYILGEDTSPINKIPPKPKITDLKGDHYYILGEDTPQVNKAPPKPKRVNIPSHPLVAKDRIEPLKSNHPTSKPSNCIVISEMEDGVISTPVSKPAKLTTSLPLTRSMIFEDFTIGSNFSNFASEIKSKYNI